MSGLTLLHEETDVEPLCSVVFGGGRLGDDDLTDMRRIELRFSGAGEVRASRKHDNDDIEASGFQVADGYDGPIEDYLDWRHRVWRESGICPRSGFYVALKSGWLDSLAISSESAWKHYVLAGRDGYIEAVADGFAWREWIWISGHRDSLTNDADVVGSGEGVD